MTENEVRKQYTQPLIVGVAFASLAELALLLFYGVYLRDEASSPSRSWRHLTTARDAALGLHCSCIGMSWSFM